MTPQERQLIDDLFDRLAQLERAPRDPEAAGAIAQGLQRAPNAAYALVQTVLVQDEALKRANHRIQELKQAQAPQQTQSGGGFLDSMRDTIFGGSQSRGSVPNVPPPAPSRPVWNSGQVMSQTPSGYQAQPGYQSQPGGYDQGYGHPQGGIFGGGGNSFLGTAAAAAAGMVGGSLLLGGIRNMMGGIGGPRQAFGDTTIIEERPGSSSSPWSDQSGSSLASDAGINDIGGSRDHDAGGRAGLFDQASSDDYSDDTDFDTDDGGNDDGGSDYA
jgi:uncharacterized protein